MNTISSRCIVLLLDLGVQHIKTQYTWTDRKWLNVFSDAYLTVIESFSYKKLAWEWHLYSPIIIDQYAFDTKVISFEATTFKIPKVPFLAKYNLNVTLTCDRKI